LTEARQKPVVALSMRVLKLPDCPEPRDTISHDWLARLGAWEMTPVLVPNIGADAKSSLARLAPNLLVLTGGEDIGETPERDDAETAMFDHAVETGLPVLGVCRGLQLINTRLGGTLISMNGHAGASHSVSVAPMWTGLYADEVEVNSYHNLGVAADGLGDGLVATASDANGNVEAFCHRDKPLAAVMWHPERDDPIDGDRRLLTGLIENGVFWT
jgi:gamma-glutamyl-gamma-aminobutyrate hydrolase PuuD